MSKSDISKKKAAALRYDPERDDVPVVTAIGLGHVAERIIETAKENKVPVMENKSLVEVLSGLSVGSAIPPKLYEAVAQILVFISSRDGKYVRRKP